MVLSASSSFNSGQMQQGSKKLKKIIIISLVVILLVALFIGYNASREYRMKGIVRDTYAQIESAVPSGVQKKERYGCTTVAKTGARYCDYQIMIEDEGVAAYNPEALATIRQTLLDAGWKVRLNDDDPLDLKKSFLPRTSCFVSGSSRKGYTTTRNETIYETQPDFQINLFCREDY